MAQNSKFTIQIMEKIGAPLAAAIESVPLKGEDTEIESAKLMAQMMGQAVQISIALNSSLNVTESEEQADSTRLALAALAAPLLANFYRQNERVPEDADIKRMVKSQEAVLAFAENFTPAAEGSSRLTTIDHDAPLFDETQVSLVLLQALTPVITAIAEFPFGQSETKILQDVFDRLKTDASEVASGNKLGEAMAVKALAEIYADCHRAETARLATASDESRGDLSLDPVWEAYQTRVAMVNAIMGSGADKQSEPAVSTPAETNPAPAATEAPVAAQPAPAAPPAGGGGSPMGFFKPGGATPAPTAEPAPTAAETPAAPVERPPAEAPPVADTPAEAPSSPMGFFKPGAKKEDDNDTTSA